MHQTIVAKVASRGEIILLVTQEVVIEPLWQLGGGTAAASLGPPWALELNFHFLIKF